MRILMYGWEFPPFNSGGLGVACLGLTQGLSACGDEIVFVMPKTLDIQTPYARIRYADTVQQSVARPLTDRHAVTTIAVNSPITPYSSREHQEQIYHCTRSDGSRVHVSVYGDDLMKQVLEYAAHAAAIAREEPHDVIYAHDWLSFGAGIEAKQASGKPLVVHVHATEVDRCGTIQSVNPLVYDLERAGMHAADRIIAVSEWTRSIIIEHYGVPREKISVVHNGIDETTVPELSEGRVPLRTFKSQGYSIVLFLGRITLQKGPDYFLQAAQIALQHNKKILFVISGSGDMEHSVMQNAAALGIAQNVLFTGFLQGSDRAIAYDVADLFVMPSVSEPFGITPLEAMRLGTPVMISHQSGVSEVVYHALKVDFWDTQEMANKILTLIAHPALKKHLIQEGLNESKKITWEKAALCVDSILHTVVHTGV